MATRYYRPRLVKQMDGSRLQGSNCTMASGATLLDRHTLGARRTTGARMRTFQYDQSGGTDLNDLDTAWHRGFGQDLDVRQNMAWSDIVANVRNGRACVLQVWYGTLGSYRWQYNFYGNHAVEFNETGYIRPDNRTAISAGLMLDPLGDWPRWVPLATLRNAASDLRLASGRTVANGYGYAGFARRIGIYTSTSTPTKPSGTVPTLVLTKPPTPAEVNPMIPGTGLVRTSSHVMSLKKGQPLYRTPGGPIAARLQGDYKLEYFGSAGTGWRCVEVSTGSPYSDGKTRPTLVYVPSSAGPISVKK
jgi:hypothetical protein